MKANPEKCHVIWSLNLHGKFAWSSSEKLLGITLDSELKLEEHINKICNIVNKKLNTLHRTGSHMSLDNRKMLLRSFIEYKFRYSGCFIQELLITK